MHGFRTGKFRNDFKPEFKPAPYRRGDTHSKWPLNPSQGSHDHTVICKREKMGAAESKPGERERPGSEHLLSEVVAVGLFGSISSLDVSLV